VIAAGLATVRHLKNHERTIYSHLLRMGESLRSGLQVRLQRAGIPAHVGGIGPVAQVSLTGQKDILNYRDWASRDTASYERIVRELVERGIRTITRGTWYVSAAHSEEDINQTLAAFEVALSAVESPART
jgi:glutamate-1-semialdehyde 2,1-aminomutase